jgi:hypothetical protein
MARLLLLSASHRYARGGPSSQGARMTETAEIRQLRGLAGSPFG